jgi:hypothetical protein
MVRLHGRPYPAGLIHADLLGAVAPMLSEVSRPFTTSSVINGSGPTSFTPYWFGPEVWSTTSMSRTDPDGIDPLAG